MSEREHDTGITRRRIIETTGAAAGAAGLAGLAGCLGDGGATETDGSGDMTPNDTPFEIVHWWTAGGEQEALQALLDGYKSEYGHEVNNNPAPGGAGSALAAEIKSRVRSDDPPSTFQIWPGKSLTPYSSADVLEDIGDSVWSQEMRDNYLSGVKKLAKRDGSFVSVPLNIHRLNNLFYNVSVLEEAGVDPSSIDSQEALISAMEAVESETDAVGMAQQTSIPWSTVQLWETVFIAEQSVSAFNDLLSGNASSHESGIRSALETVSSFSEFYPEDSGSISWDQGNGRVIDGGAAFIHQGDWAAGQYKATDGFEYESDWGHVAYPGTEGVYSLVMDSFVKPSNNPTPIKTDDFLSYCGTPEAQVAFNTKKGSIPPRTDVDASNFGPFLSSQIEDFGDSDKQPPTIAHGTGLAPEKKTKVETAISGFLESGDVDQTTSKLVSAIGN
jgi:glucose/mannose transport system substrate-binding protein